MTSKAMTLLAVLLPSLAFGGLSVGDKPKPVVLDKDAGGRVAGGAWSSDDLKGKIAILFYVDPDFADLNNAASEALKAANFDEKLVHSTAVINMAATWLPNFAIDGKLKSKQKDYPTTTYVRDLHKALVKAWKLADDNSGITVFDKEGKVIFAHEGKLNDAQIKTMLEAIKQNL